MKPTLARLERVSLRNVWKHEAGEFTPWLAQDENPQRLAEALDLPELNLDAIEHPVGDFRVDILCSDETGPVIIENQLERTNHAHLGQILTYAAGVGAKKVVWVAESFRPEHVAELYIHNAQAKAIFHALHAQREAIEAELGFAPDWQELPDSDACRICVARPASDLADESAWPTYFAWLTDTLTRLAAAFRPRVKDL